MSRRFMGMSIIIVLLFWNVQIQATPINNDQVDELQHQKFRLRTDAVTISGFSSGGAMASQFHISHSKLFTGLGVFSSVYYRCAGDTRNKTYCFLEEGNSPEKSISDAMEYESLHLIDYLKNLANQKIFIWIGTKDEQPPRVQTRLHTVNFYQKFIPNPENIFTKIQAASHLMPTDRVNQTCDEITKSPDKFLGNCNYSGTYEMFKFLIGDSIRRPSNDFQLEPIRLFNQSVYFDNNLQNPEMDEVGLYYVPKNCKHGKRRHCLLHMYFHGCGLTRSLGGTNFLDKSGFLEVAEENDIVLIFPQSLATEDNPRACWDTDGRLDQNYGNKNGTQIQTSYAILDSLLRNSDNSGSILYVSRNLFVFGLMLVFTFI